LNSATPATAGS